ncbi:MAG TPA: hypothetical protein VMH35_22850 [Streptosporangiaceae bacterium]|nr:hypothetical protein [Streptosporangiaceae bacterium]
MTDPRDDLDAWMKTQVQPLPPPPGTFELIRKRARRRKMTRAAATAAGAAAVIAVIATVPRLVLTQLHSGPGPAASSSDLGQSSAANGSRHHQRASAPPQPTPDPTPSAVAPPAAPPDFAATSVTFVGTATGYVLGQAGTPGHCGPPSAYICTSIAGTSDGGRTWHGVHAPVAGAPQGPSGVSQVRFYNTSDGWAFGPQLWATHDGGRTWKRIGTGGRRVTALETAGQRVFAVWAQCTGRGADWAAGCTGQALQEAAPGSNRWAPVPGAGARFSVSGTASAAALVLTGRRGYLLAPDGMLLSGPVTSAGGWQPVTGTPAPCLPGAAQADGQPGGAMLASTTTGLVLVCPGAATGGSQTKTVYTLAAGARAWLKAASAPSAGTATSVSGSAASTIVLASTAGIEVSRNGGASWTAGQGTLPAGGFSYVGMTTADQGVAVPADPAVHAVWFSYDGGATWQESPIG